MQFLATVAVAAKSEGCYERMTRGSSPGSSVPMPLLQEIQCTDHNCLQWRKSNLERSRMNKTKAFESTPPEDEDDPIMRISVSHAVMNKAEVVIEQVSPALDC